MMQYKWVQSAPKWNCMKFDTHFQSKPASKQLIHEKYVCSMPKMQVVAYARNFTSCDRPSKFVFNKSLLVAIISKLFLISYP